MTSQRGRQKGCYLKRHNAIQKKCCSTVLSLGECRNQTRREGEHKHTELSNLKGDHRGTFKTETQGIHHPAERKKKETRDMKKKNRKKKIYKK
jgi:hypothetical protein